MTCYWKGMFELCMYSCTTMQQSVEALLWNKAKHTKVIILPYYYIVILLRQYLIYCYIPSTRKIQVLESVSLKLYLKIFIKISSQHPKAYTHSCGAELELTHGDGGVKNTS